MKHLLVVTGALASLTSFAVLADDTMPSGQTQDITGSYTCSGTMATNHKKIKGTLEIQKGADGSSYTTTWTYEGDSASAHDSGTLMAAEKKNTYIQQWHSDGSPMTVGVARFDFDNSKFKYHHASINGATGKIENGSGSCKKSTPDNTNATTAGEKTPSSGQEE